MLRNPFDKTPKWIKKLADTDSNKVLLLRIIDYTKEPIETPKKMLFAIRGFKDQRSAEAAIHGYLDKEGWLNKVILDEEQQKYAVESEKTGYIISREGLLRDEALFSRVAGLYGAEYDGWTVVLPPK